MVNIPKYDPRMYNPNQLGKSAAEAFASRFVQTLDQNDARRVATEQYQRQLAETKAAKQQEQIYGVNKEYLSKGYQPMLGDRAATPTEQVTMPDKITWKEPSGMKDVIPGGWVDIKTDKILWSDTQPVNTVPLRKGVLGYLSQENRPRIMDETYDKTREKKLADKKWAMDYAKSLKEDQIESQIAKTNTYIYKANEPEVSKATKIESILMNSWMPQGKDSKGKSLGKPILTKAEALSAVKLAGLDVRKYPNLVKLVNAYPDKEDTDIFDWTDKSKAVTTSELIKRNVPELFKVKTYPYKTSATKDGVTGVLEIQSEQGEQDAREQGYTW